MTEICLSNVPWISRTFLHSSVVLKRPCLKGSTLPTFPLSVGIADSGKVPVPILYSLVCHKYVLWPNLQYQICSTRIHLAQSSQQYPKRKKKRNGMYYHLLLYYQMAPVNGPSAVAFVKSVLCRCLPGRRWIDYLSSCSSHVGLRSLPRSRIRDWDNVINEWQGKYWVMCIYWDMAGTKGFLKIFFNEMTQNGMKFIRVSINSTPKTILVPNILLLFETNKILKIFWASNARGCPFYNPNENLEQTDYTTLGVCIANLQHRT